MEGFGGFGCRMREFTAPLKGPELLAGNIAFMLLCVRSCCAWSLGGSGSRFFFFQKLSFFCVVGVSSGFRVLVFKTWSRVLI